MKNSSSLDRRDFVKLGTMAVSASLFPQIARAESPPTPATLPPLPYAFDALEPHIDAKTMEIHHDKHHAAYIEKLNAALAKEPKLAEMSLTDLIAGLPDIKDESVRTTIRNQGGGHWNHDFFWKCLAPAATHGKPSADLTAAINAAFGSEDAFMKSFGEAAAKRFGSGWAWLVWKDGALKITSTANQDNPLMKGIVPDADLGKPLLGLDVWEHAYYLKYQNRRPEYVAAWWNVVNWNAVSERLVD